MQNRRDFVHVQQSGQRFRGRLLAVLIAQRVAGSELRVGYTVSRKVGKAVTRNRVRRRLREIVRCRADVWVAGCDAVLIAYPGAATASFLMLQQEAQCLLARALKWAQRRDCSSAS